MLHARHVCIKTTSIFRTKEPRTKQRRTGGLCCLAASQGGTGGRGNSEGRRSVASEQLRQLDALAGGNILPSFRPPARPGARPRPPPQDCQEYLYDKSASFILHSGPTTATSAHAPANLTCAPSSSGARRRRGRASGSAWNSCASWARRRRPWRPWASRPCA